MIKEPISNALWWAFLRRKRRFSNTAVRFPMALVQISFIYRGFGRFSLTECVRAGVPVCARTRKVTTCLAGQKLMLEARLFFFECLNAQADFVAVENPLPMALAKLPKPSCFVQPFWYGHKYSKKTLYWLRNLPPLMPDCENPDYKSFVRASRGKYRARTFTGIAQAIAKQWGEYVVAKVKKMQPRKRKGAKTRG